MTLNCPHSTQFLITMFNKETAIGMLRQGNNGEEILSILDAIVADEVSTTAGNVPGQVVDFEGNPTEF